jgi:hypothetical protein
MLVACRLAGLSALERTMLTTTPKRNPASKSKSANRASHGREKSVRRSHEGQRHENVRQGRVRAESAGA